MIYGTSKHQHAHAPAAAVATLRSSSKALMMLFLRALSPSLAPSNSTKRRMSVTSYRRFHSRVGVDGAAVAEEEGVRAAEEKSEVHDRKVESNKLSWICFANHPRASAQQKGKTKLARNNIITKLTVDSRRHVTVHLHLILSLATRTVKTSSLCTQQGIKLCLAFVHMLVLVVVVLVITGSDADEQVV